MVDSFITYEKNYEIKGNLKDKSILCYLLNSQVHINFKKKKKLTSNIKFDKKLMDELKHVPFKVT